MRCAAKSLACLWDFLRLFVALFNGQNQGSVSEEANQMMPKYFRLLIVAAAFGLLWPVSPATAQGGQDSRIGHYFDVVTTAGEFVAEITILSDGRVYGGFGLRESGTGVLSLYRVVAMQQTGDHFRFEAERLWPSTATGIHFNVKRRGNSRDEVFVVDGLPTSDGRPLSFTAEGTMSSDCIGDPPCKALPEFSFIKSPAETLVAQGLTGPYTATFENVALVFSNGLAIGSFALTAPDGTPQNARIVSGEVQFQNGEAINAWLRGKTSTAEDSSPMPVLMVIANRDFS
jgi:hypothetical protein